MRFAHTFAGALLGEREARSGSGGAAAPASARSAGHTPRLAADEAGGGAASGKLASPAHLALLNEFKVGSERGGVPGTLV